MRHSYEFFDRGVFDPVWSLTWRDFQRQHGGRWARRMAYSRGCYDGSSLRGLISFCMGPEPNSETVEEIVEERTVEWTVQHSSGQFYFLSELMSHVRGHRSGHYSVEEIEDVAPLISAATHAYLAHKIAVPVLLAVLKLHRCTDPGEWVSLPRDRRRTLKALTSSIDLWRPIYSWQGKRACVEEEWTNCLAVQGTRHFISFIRRAWDENWLVTGLKDRPRGIEDSHAGMDFRFRDFRECCELRKAVSKVQGFKKPCVYRVWA